LIKHLTLLLEELVDLDRDLGYESVCKTISLNWGAFAHAVCFLHEYANFGVEVPLRSLFETPTIEAIAKYIEAVSWVTLVQTRV